MQVNERWNDPSRHPLLLPCIQTVNTTANQVVFLLTSAPGKKGENCSMKHRFIYLFVYFLHLTGQNIVHKRFRTRSEWTDQYYKAINTFSFAESFFRSAAVTLQLRLCQGLAVRAAFYHVFTALDRSPFTFFDNNNILSFYIRMLRCNCVIWVFLEVLVLPADLGTNMH